MATELEVDVCVVGAGLAGLVAARDLEAGGAAVIVLEARDRVGGRTEAEPVGGGEIVEVGGQWVGPTQDRVAALISELGLETFPTFGAGKSLLELGKKIRRYEGTIPKVGPTSLGDIALARRRLEKLAEAVDTEAPWKAERAIEHDSQTLATFLESTMRTKQARALIRIAGRTIWGAEPDELSLLHVLFYVASAGGLDPLLDVEGGAQQDRILGGSQLLARRLAGRLRTDVMTGLPVRAIDDRERGVKVVADSTTVRARRAIVALPPPLRAGIAFHPAHPPDQAQLAQRMPQGWLIKCAAVYEAPFWREDGLSGESVSDRGPATLTYDNSPPGGEPGVLLGFVGGSDARRLCGLGKRERREAVLKGFERLFGDGVRRPDAYIERDWARERWSGGGPTCFFGPGGWTGYGAALRRPAGRVHWAGTETATRWAGFMDGAIRSGERAAAEVLDRLS